MDDDVSLEDLMAQLQQAQDAKSTVREGENVSRKTIGVRLHCRRPNTDKPRPALRTAPQWSTR